MHELFEAALERMAPVTVEQYYSLCGRLDTIEHIQDVLFAQAQQKQAEQLAAAEKAAAEKAAGKGDEN
jgi:hypothetical protein